MAIWFGIYAAEDTFILIGYCISYTFNQKEREKLLRITQFESQNIQRSKDSTKAYYTVLTMSNISHRKPVSASGSRLNRRRSSLSRSRPDRPHCSPEVPTVIFVPCQMECLNRWSPESTASMTSCPDKTMIFQQQEKRRSTSSSSRCATLLMQDSWNRSFLSSYKDDLESSGGDQGDQTGSGSIAKSTTGSQCNTHASVRRRSSVGPPSLPRRQRSSVGLDLN